MGVTKHRMWHFKVLWHKYKQRLKRTLNKMTLVLILFVNGLICLWVAIWPVLPDFSMACRHVYTLFGHFLMTQNYSMDSSMTELTQETHRYIIDRTSKNKQLIVFSLSMMHLYGSSKCWLHFGGEEREWGAMAWRTFHTFQRYATHGMGYFKINNNIKYILMTGKGSEQGKTKFCIK